MKQELDDLGAFARRVLRSEHTKRGLLNAAIGLLAAVVTEATSAQLSAPPHH